MSYIENNLMRNETIIHQGKIHWFIFVPGIVLLIIGFGILGSSLNSELLPLLFTALFFIAIYSIIKAAVIKMTTELAVTSKRVIAKTGLIRRDTVELNHNRVESFYVHQSIVGRLMGFGTIDIAGTGGGRTPIPGIEDPLGFRRYAMQTIDESEANMTTRNVAHSG